jgi:hypothetical protein
VSGRVTGEWIDRDKSRHQKALEAPERKAEPPGDDSAMGTLN